MIINNKVIQFNNSFYTNIKKKWYGINFNFYTQIENRLETFNKKIINEFLQSQLLTLSHVFNSTIPKNLNVDMNLKFNLIHLDFLFFYRGWRHIKQYPSRGQRTWSNASTAKTNNNKLKSLKIKQIQLNFKKIESGRLNTILFAEYYNLLWKNQWYGEWRKARKRVTQIKNNKKVIFKVDLLNMSKGNVNIFREKKTKAEKKKTSLNLGFDTGFTKNALNSVATKKSTKRITYIFEEAKVKLNQKKKKIKPQKKVEKKKKSLWE